MNDVATECRVRQLKNFPFETNGKNWSVGRFKISELAGYFFDFCYLKTFSMGKNIFIIYNLDVVCFKLQILLKPLIRSI